MPRNLQVVLKDMFMKFEDEYQSLIADGLASFSRSEDIFEDLKLSAKGIACDFSLNYRTQILKLISRIFAYWSLKSTNCFVHDDKVLLSPDTIENYHTKQDNEDGRPYLLKPHAAQVVAIWILLNFQHEEYRILKNKFVQVLTGEDKSIILGVTAIILAMMGCNVECVCYSEYLSSRDHGVFREIFDDFEVESYIHYGTIRGTCHRILCGEGNLRGLTKDLVWGRLDKEPTPKRSKLQKRMKVLLVDEVDVFFKEDFYGNTNNPVWTCRHQSI